MELSLIHILYWLFRNKGVMPWEVYERGPGYRDLAFAFAQKEREAPDFLQSPAVELVRRVK